LRSLEDRKGGFDQRGVRLVAISVDPAAVSKKLAADQGYSYLFLSDETRTVLRQWDLLHEKGHDGQDISRPAEFLIDPDGIVRWVNLSDNFMQRLDADEALRAIDAVRGGSEDDGRGAGRGPVAVVVAALPPL